MTGPRPTIRKQRVRRRPRPKGAPESKIAPGSSPVDRRRHPEIPRDHRRPARGLILVLVLLLAGTLSWREETSLDLGFHLATGRTILEQRAWPSRDPFTYTVPHRPYIDMHGLFQVALALADRAAGLAGIGLLRVALVLGATAILWATARRLGARSPVLLGVGFALGLVAWEMRFFARPELATYVLLALELYLLRRHAEDGRARWLYALVPLQLVWVYSHALSLFGIAVLTLYALASMLRTARHDRTPWVALALCAGVMLLNPYGPAGLAFLWNLRTRLESGNVFAGSISELSSPFSSTALGIWPLLAFKVLLVAGGLAVIFSLRRLKPFDLGLFALFGALGAAAVRNIGLFVVACLPVALAAAQHLLDRRARKRKARHSLGSPIGVIALSSVLLVLVAEVIAANYYVSNRRPERFGSGLSAAAYPLRTVEFIQEHAFRGPVFNHLNFGGYLIGELWPQEKVFIDGRLEVMGEAFFQEYLDVNAGPRWPEMMRRYQPNLALISITSLNQMKRLFQDPEWALVELDGVATLFVRVKPENQAIRDEAAARWRAFNQPGGAEEVPLAPRATRAWLAGALEARRFPWETWGRGNAFYGLGLYEAARKEYRRALLEAGWDEPALVTNYAAANFHLGRLVEARTWYRRLLELDRGNRIARERIAWIDARLGGGGG